MIKFLQNKDIDKKFWDEVVCSSPSSRVYAQSWFLDAVCPNWCALVEDDYKAVLPLPFRKKWSITYVFPPLFAQQLGLFCQKDFSTRLETFINSLPRNIRYAYLKFNDQNIFEQLGDWKIQSNMNFCLALDKPYNILFKSYSDNTKRNIKKASASGISIEEKLSVKDFIEFSKKNQPENYPKEFISVLEKLINASFERNVGEIWAALDKDGNVISALFWIRTSERSYYLSPLSNEAGKESRAMFLIIDRIIQKLAGNSQILDFEGSNIESVARFYKGFGAENFSYKSLIINRLPWPFKLLKT